MEPDEIIKMVSLCVSLLISLFGFVVAVIKEVKLKKWDQIKSVLITFIEKAEEYTTYSGAEKKTAVLKWTKEFCDSHNIKFDVEKVSEQIEELVEFTKKVNKKDN